MFVLGNLLDGAVYIVGAALTLYEFIVVARALISWVNPDPWNPIVQFLHRATDPVLDPIRRMIGWRVGIDLSPLIVIFAIEFIQRGILPSIARIAGELNR